MAASKQRWWTTREPNLLRNTASGRYYGRFTLSGKQKWVNLETDVWTVAKIRLADERAKIGRLRQTADSVTAWLGHADGGALLMRVYAHHRRAHSIAQAAKVLADI